MKKRSFFRLFTALAVFMAVCLVSFGISGYVFAQDKDKDKENEGRRISREAQVALVEAQRRLETNPDDQAAARQPLIDFMAAPPAAMPDQPNPIPMVMYQMLGQLWYSDTKAKNNIAEAQKIFKAGHEAYPEDEVLLYNYAATTYELEHFLDAAPLFEQFYDLSAKHDVKYLTYSAAAYYAGGDLKDAKRIFVRMIGSVEKPESTWLEQIISICQQQEDPKEAEKYIKLAIGFYPMEPKYWNLMGNSFIEKEDYKSAASAYEIATRVKTPDKGSQWRTLIDLYNYIGLPLRSAWSIQKGFDLLVKSGQEDDEYILVADAYVRGARVDKAISYLDNVLSKKSSFKLLLKKGTILLNALRNKEAIAVFDECIAMDAKAWDAYYLKGWAAWDLKDWETAKKAFDKAVNSKDYRAQAQDALDMLASLDEAKSK